MSEFHFRSHFWPFQIDTQLNFFWKFLTKWLTSAILDVRNSLSIAFLAISDQYSFLIFLQNGCRWPFWMSEIHFRWHFWPFQIHTELYLFFDKMATGGHFGCPQITFDRISGHFRFWMGRQCQLSNSCEIFG